ncbi:MAG: hypothetical protein QXW58_03080 [Thermosphaera sp.]
MVRCPFCGFETDANSFKLLREPWRYRVHEVRRLECPGCKGLQLLRGFFAEW